MHIALEQRNKKEKKKIVPISGKFQTSGKTNEKQ